MSSFAIFLIWYLASMIVVFPLTFQWINYLLKEHRRKEIGKQHSSGANDFVVIETDTLVIEPLVIPITKHTNVGSTASLPWTQPPTPEHAQVAMPRGMGGSSSFDCWKNVPGCYCKSGYSYGGMYLECRDEPQRDRYSRCVCPPEDDK